MINKELQERILSSLILVPIILFFIVKGSIFFIFFLLVCFLITSYEWYVMSKNKQYNIPGHLFLIISFYFAYLWRQYLTVEADYFLLIILICASTDLGGYTFGKLFKGPKLTKISPNKTYAGVLGGYSFSLIFVSILLYSDFYFSLEPWFYDPLRNFIFVFTVSTISQLGDIIISYFKRLSKIKDTGKIIPGHGGLLDRTDGMLFAFPITYLIFYYQFGFWIW